MAKIDYGWLLLQLHHKIENQIMGGGWCMQQGNWQINVIIYNCLQFFGEMMPPQVQDFLKSLFSFKQQQNLMITYYKLIKDHTQPSHWEKFTKKSPHSIVELLIISIIRYYYWKFLLLEMMIFALIFYLLNGHIFKYCNAQGCPILFQEIQRFPQLSIINLPLVLITIAYYGTSTLSKQCT